MTGCCARATSGQANAAPPENARKSRRLINTPRSPTHVPCHSGPVLGTCLKCGQLRWAARFSLNAEPILCALTSALVSHWADCFCREEEALAVYLRTEHSLVAPTSCGDLLICAKDLFVEATAGPSWDVPRTKWCAAHAADAPHGLIVG
jgi:hypothetical protein